MIEALSALPSIAQAAANTAPANSWAPLFSSAVPGVFGAAIGYLFGTMRDWNRNKADRRAKHQDEVLAAATEILASVSKLVESARTFTQSMTKASVEIYPPGARVPDMATDELFADFTGRDEMRTEITPHRLRLRILAPSLDKLAQNLIDSARFPILIQSGVEADRARRKYQAANAEFDKAVRNYLQVSR